MKRSPNNNCFFGSFFAEKTFYWESFFVHWKPLNVITDIVIIQLM